MDFRFASVAACGCCDKDCRVICYYLVYIYCPKESKCHALARFVLFVRLVFEKTFAYVKLNTNLPLTNHLICRQNQKTNPSTFPLVLPRYNQNQNENQKMKILFFAIATLQNPDTMTPRFDKLPRFLTLGGTETMLTNYKKHEQHVIIADSVDRFCRTATTDNMGTRRKRTIYHTKHLPVIGTYNNLIIM